MQDISRYLSPLGQIFLSAKEGELTGLWFDGQTDHRQYLQEAYTEKELPIFADTRRWLDIYFSGREPDFTLPIRYTGSAFQMEVWELLRTIPYGQTVTYGEIARILAQRRGILRMSAQAVGGAVGRNRLSIVIPCHRVVGANGCLTGYAGGLERKTELLKLEARGITVHDTQNYQHR